MKNNYFALFIVCVAAAQAPLTCATDRYEYLRAPLTSGLISGSVGLLFLAGMKVAKNNLHAAQEKYEVSMTKKNKLAVDAASKAFRAWAWSAAAAAAGVLGSMAWGRSRYKELEHQRLTSDQSDSRQNDPNNDPGQVHSINRQEQEVAPAAKLRQAFEENNSVAILDLVKAQPDLVNRKLDVLLLNKFFRGYVAQFEFPLLGYLKLRNQKREECDENVVIALAGRLSSGELGPAAVLYEAINDFPAMQALSESMVDYLIQNRVRLPATLLQKCLIVMDDGRAVCKLIQSVAPDVLLQVRGEALRDCFLKISETEARALYDRFDTDQKKQVAKKVVESQWLPQSNETEIDPIFRDYFLHGELRLPPHQIQLDIMDLLINVSVSELESQGAALCKKHPWLFTFSYSREFPSFLHYYCSKKRARSSRDFIAWALENGAANSVENQEGCLPIDYYVGACCRFMDLVERARLAVAGEGADDPFVIKLLTDGLTDEQLQKLIERRPSILRDEYVYDLCIKQRQLHIQLEICYVEKVMGYMLDDDDNDEITNWYDLWGKSRGRLIDMSTGFLMRLVYRKVSSVGTTVWAQLDMSEKVIIAKKLLARRAKIGKSDQEMVAALEQEYQLVPAAE